MSELTMYGGGAIKAEGERDATQEDLMRINENETSTAYQLARIKSLTARLDASPY